MVFDATEEIVAAIKEQITPDGGPYGDAIHFVKTALVAARGADGGMSDEEYRAIGRLLKQVEKM